MSSSAFLSRLRESEHPFQGWLPSSTWVMASDSIADDGAVSVETSPTSAEWAGSGEVPFLFLFATPERIPGDAFAGAPAERELWEKMVGALGFAPVQARMGTLNAWREARLDGEFAVVAVGVSPDEARVAGVAHVLPTLAELVRDAALKRPAWKTLQDAAAAIGWKIPAPRGSRG